MARTAEALMPQILHRAGGVRRARVRPSQPFAELVRRLCRRRAVERHQRGRHAGNPDDVGAPAIFGDVGDLDQVVASRDGFFEAMNGGGHGGMDSTLLCAVIKRSGSRKRTHNRRPRVLPTDDASKKIYVSIDAQEIHQPSTGFPQLDLFQAAHYA